MQEELKTLREKYNCNVGYSGHEKAVAISIAAAVLGATSVERHITLDRTMYGSDRAASLEPQGFQALVNGIRKVKVALGDGEIGFILESEKTSCSDTRGQLILPRSYSNCCIH